MADSTYTAGLRFVVSTPSQALDEHDRRGIRSHATRAGGPHRKTAQLSSWITPKRKFGFPRKLARTRIPASETALSIPIPRQVGSDLSGLQLPSGFEPDMVQGVVKLIELNKFGGYPHEICLNVHPVERGWFPYMISDDCCLHSMMFSLRAFVDSTSHNQPSLLACYHYAQTLQLLQTRLNEFDQTSLISDPTIMVVVTLATAAELSGDFIALENHIKGLEKIVNLRGGVRALNTNDNNLHVKVCRADLAYALLLGHRPLFFKEGMPWDCFIADRGLIQCSHQPHDAHVRAFAAANLDTRLHSALSDLHSFSCISNLAYQTTRKLSPEIYNEMMISILYRLTHLSFESDPLQEIIRIGLLAFSSTIFMQRNFITRPYEHLVNLYSDALSNLLKSTEADLPLPLLLWLTMLSHMVVYKELSPTDWRSFWLDKAILRAGVSSWAQGLEILRSIAWVDFIHDGLGKKAFELAIVRLER